MVASNTFGRQVIVPLTNKSGGGVIAGDVVILDSANNDSFTTTTTVGYAKNIGVAQETIANNATGRILVSGYAALVNVNASVTRLNFGKTYSVAKQATDAGSSRLAGTFCTFLSSGTTPDALVWPASDLGALTNPMTTTGDIIYSSDNSGTPARRGIGSTGQVLTVSGGVPQWAAASAGVAVAVATGTGSADYTTTSTSFADVDGTNLAITPTNAASGDILEIMAMFVLTDGNGNNAVTFGIAGTDVGDTLGLLWMPASSTVRMSMTMLYHYTMPSSTQPAIKLRWKMTGTATAVTMYNRSAVTRPRLIVKNLSRGGTL